MQKRTDDGASNGDRVSERPRILVSNDDGIFSRGIRALVDGLAEIGEVIVVAPNAQQSAVGHALTVASPLRIERYEHEGKFFGYAINGTPADCVKLAVRHILESPPDLLVSGINHGRNTATSIVYSGTVSGATEGTMLGIPSLAVSLDSHAPDADFSGAVEATKRLTQAILERGPPAGTLLNVNVPNVPSDQITGIRIVPQGTSYWNDHYEERRDPMGNAYYWLYGEYVREGTDSDDHAVDENCVAVTPIAHRLTDEAMLLQLRSWNLESPDAQPAAVETSKRS